MSDTTRAGADVVDATILLRVLEQAKSGDFTARMPTGWTGLAGRVAESLNDLMVAGQALQAQRVDGKSDPDTGTAAIEWAEQPIGGLRNALIDEFGYLAAARGLGFAIDVAANVPEVIVTDPRRLDQILKILIANAFTFTERGDIRVHMTVTDSGGNPLTESRAVEPSMMAISVADTGSGIGKEQQLMICEALMPGDRLARQNHTGGGLGLWISRELAGLLGGRITLASEWGQGSTFTVHLPLRHPMPRPDVPAHIPTSESPAPASKPVYEHGASSRDSNEITYQDPLVGAKVMVVDDDFRNVFAMVALLGRLQVDITIAVSGPDAIATLDKKHDIAIILMDIMMPGMDGYATMRAIRALAHYKTVPIIAVTGKAVAGEYERCLEAGATDCVFKPIHTTGLLALMRPWLLSPQTHS